MIFAYVSRALRVASSYVCGQCLAFTDASFTFRAESIGAVDGVDPADVAWVRAPELGAAKRYSLFDGAIRPSDLVQGELGDCYLVTALACLAESPAAVRNIFYDNERTARGRYALRIFDGSATPPAWVDVVIDDFIPIHKATRAPIFIEPHGGQLYAALVEKAFAKFCGSYHAIEAGHTEWAWHALTGDPAFMLEKSADGEAWERNDLVCTAAENRRGALFSAPGERVLAGALFGVLQAYISRRCVVGASIYKTADVAREQALDDGLIAGHAYSVIDVRRAGRSVADTLQDTHKSGVTLVKLRNPWGGKASWSGAWSLESSCALRCAR